MRRSSPVLVAVTLLAVVGTSFYSQGQPQNQPPRPARSRADETLAMWNSIANKLIAMAQDFPEDKYDFKVQRPAHLCPNSFTRRRGRLPPDTDGFRVEHRA